MLRTECIVVGAGVIGLAIARRLAMDGRKVVVLERAAAIGTETSARSNEVIHAGIYYRPGSPQAVLCGRGREALYAYCTEHGVEHIEIGKLIVATDDGSVDWLETMHAQAIENGVPGLEMLSGDAAARLEPNLRCRAALWSRRTGIVDTHGLMLAYQGDAEDHGAAFAFNTTLVGGTATGSGFDLETTSADGERTPISCENLINAAGIWAPQVARGLVGMPENRIPHIYLAKGAFFVLRGKSPFTRLIVPEPKTWRLGGIFTLDRAMRGRFGPDEAWVEEVDYGLEGWPMDHVYAAVRRYFPDLGDGVLTPDYAGIRPRLHGPDEAPTDWLFQGPAEHGVNGLINLFGFETPGITASLPIADAVAGMLGGRPLPFAIDPTKYGSYKPSPPPAVEA